MKRKLLLMGAFGVSSCAGSTVSQGPEPLLSSEVPHLEAPEEGNVEEFPSKVELSETVEERLAPVIRDRETDPICRDWKLQKQVPIEERQFCYKRREPPSVAPEYQAAVDWVLGAAAHMEWWGGMSREKVGNLNVEHVLRVMPLQGYRVVTIFPSNARHESMKKTTVELCNQERVIREFEERDGFCFRRTIDAISRGANSLYVGKADIPDFKTSGGVQIFEIKPEGFELFFSGDADHLRLEEIRAYVPEWPGH